MKNRPALNTRFELITLTSNPALDLSGHVRDLVVNEKNYVFQTRRDPGGNGINSARLATRLGCKTRAFGFLGGIAGSEIQLLLDQEQVRHAFTPIAQETRTNVTVTNEHTHDQTRLTFPGPTISRKELNAHLKQMSRLRWKGILCIGGSLAPGLGLDLYEKWIKYAWSLGNLPWMDIPGADLKRYLTGKKPMDRALPFLIKPNVQELALATGSKPQTQIGPLLRSAYKLTRLIPVVIVSLGRQGALLVTRNEAWQARSPQVKSKGSVGAGDSMVGAMATHLIHGGKVPFGTSLDQLSREIHTPRLSRALVDAFCYGVAAGAATSESTGTKLGDPKRVQALVSQVKVQKLKLH